VIDALFKRHADAFWDRLGRAVARTGVSPNAITWGGLLLSALNSAAFVMHRNALAYGLLLAGTELLDDLDGALARVTGRSTRYGSFLDAATDRYKETLSLLAVALVTGYWLLSFLALAGSLLVSYNHARAAMEGAAAKGADLFERFERVATLVAGLVLRDMLPRDLFFGHDALAAALGLLAVLSHVTALQRLLRGRRGLRDLDARDGR
jgi:phosphatidylglycerophosphate synthase